MLGLRTWLRDGREAGATRQAGFPAGGRWSLWLLCHGVRHDGRHRIPVVSVVGNNGIWALEKHPMQNMLGTSIAADLGPRTRYDKVVEALGGYGELVDKPDQIRPALERAVKSGLPACVNVICDPAAEYPRSSVLM